MKSIDKLTTAILWLRGDENISENVNVKLALKTLNEFLIDNQTAPSGKADLWSICKRAPENFPPMAGVYHDAEHKMAVATDTRILVASKAEYNPKFAGKIVDKYGNEFKGARFPDWQRVVPVPDKDRPYERRITIDKELCKMAIKTNKAHIKANEGRGKYPVMLKVSDNNTYGDPELMLLASAFTDALFVDEPNCPMFYRDDEKIVIVMPLFAGDNIEKEGHKHTAYSTFDGAPLF